MRIHFIGIGGIGVSALAQYYLATGHKVSGSDLTSSEIIKLLKEKGAKVFIGEQKAKNVPKNSDLVVYSPAVKEDNRELKQARKLDIECQSYPEALGELTKNHFTIAVAGAHGKSTTTAMLALILIKAGLDPTVIVGTKLREFNDSNFRMSNKPGSKILLIEACEHEAAFLNYWPKMIVLTNIEREHLDYYKNLKNILKAFREFVGHLSKGGMLVANGDDKNISNLKSSGRKACSAKGCISKIQPKAHNYSLKQREAVELRKILMVPGEYNICNALAALTAARVLKVSDKVSFKALSEFKGTWRRFEERELKIKNRSCGERASRPAKLKIIQDYAHHPTEIKALLAAAREKFPDKKICCVFQPHQYQRTFYLFKDFVKAFSWALRKHQLDSLIIIDVYGVAGREDEATRKKANSKKLVESINNSLRGKNGMALYISGGVELDRYIKKNLKNWDIFLIVGAGDIYKLGQRLTNIVKLNLL